MLRDKTCSALPLVLLVTLTLVAAACGGDEEGASTTVGGQKANDHGSQDVAGESELDLEPVSYTHLTLPTICSV